MIAPLRAWHRRMMFMLAILLPLLVLLALAFRGPAPPASELPAEAANESSRP